MRNLLLACPLLALALVAIPSPPSPSLAVRANALPPPAKAPALPSAVVPPLKDVLQPLLDKEAKEQQARTLQELQKAEKIPAHHKLPVCRKGLSEPWTGLSELERSGLAIAEAARGGRGKVGLVLDRLQAAIGISAGKSEPVPRGKLATLDDHVRYLTAVLDRAKKLRDQALTGLSAGDRTFLFGWAPQLVRNFGPQMSYNSDTKKQLLNDRAFCTFAREKFDWSAFIGSAQTLLALLDPAYLDELKKVLNEAKRIKETIPGVTGDLLLKKETPHGLILIGGKGKNTYDLKVPVALLIDLGGDDTYKGKVAASFDADHPISVVIDLEGNDRYEGDEYGLATGRLGIGLLADLGGKDTYKLATGSGGVGLCGIGVLLDAEGDDVYTGTRFTQGVGIGGIGLLLDLAGDDRYTSHGFAIGLGGPAGVGAVIDVAGNDSYQCGHHIPSGYNQSDAPGAKPGDPNFQYDAWGLGMGLGRRVFPWSEEGIAFNLAGGLGMVLDLSGNDTYDSSNFSQACGYFFGVGLKLDLSGDDRHTAARYGHASGAHFGMGLFIDYAGRDIYDSPGPTYNGGCAWDHSVFLCVDAGGDDRYLLKRTSGLGRGDIGGWGVFADLGGKDRYVCPGGVGRASQKGLGVFYDAAGDDDYRDVAKVGDFQPGNGKRHADTDGGVFIDR
ncbi:MAG TPA: hypothetical protein VKD72_04135 [Gemmataceae bacterium]|nr:hypothetical protein [Gemmataceae bacterium]